MSETKHSQSSSDNTTSSTTTSQQQLLQTQQPEHKGSAEPKERHHHQSDDGRRCKDQCAKELAIKFRSAAQQFSFSLNTLLTQLGVLANVLEIGAGVAEPVGSQLVDAISPSLLAIAGSLEALADALVCEPRLSADCRSLVVASLNFAAAFLSGIVSPLILLNLLAALELDILPPSFSAANIVQMADPSLAAVQLMALIVRQLPTTTHRSSSKKQSSSASSISSSSTSSSSDNKKRHHKDGNDKCCTISDQAAHRVFAAVVNASVISTSQGAAVMSKALSVLPIVTGTPELKITLPANFFTALAQLPAQLQVLQVAIVLQLRSRKSRCRCAQCAVMALTLAALADIYPSLIFLSFFFGFLGLVNSSSNAAFQPLIPLLNLVLLFNGLFGSVNVLASSIPLQSPCDNARKAACKCACETKLLVPVLSFLSQFKQIALQAVQTAFP